MCFWFINKLSCLQDPEPWFSICGGRRLSPAGSFTSPLPSEYQSCLLMERKGIVNIFSFFAGVTEEILQLWGGLELSFVFHRV